jgi:hypothetical protein
MLMIRATLAIYPAMRFPQVTTRDPLGPNSIAAVTPRVSLNKEIETETLPANRPTLSLDLCEQIASRQQFPMSAMA